MKSSIGVASFERLAFRSTSRLGLSLPAAPIPSAYAEAKFTFIPYKGGGEIATQLVGGHIDSDVNNPIEHIANWRLGEVRPLCVFDSERMPFKTKITDTMSWNDIPTCHSAGVDAKYLMLRAILMPKGVSADQLDYYVELLRKVRETAEWKDF